MDQRRSWQTQANSGALLPADKQVGLLYHFQNMVPFGCGKSMICGCRLALRNLLQLGQRRTQYRPGRQDDGALDKVLRLPNIARPVVELKL
jgi:hypothetical protein